MTPQSLQRRLSFNIKKARKELLLSQERLAEAAHISSQMVNDIEGCRRWPSEKTIVKIADALKVDIGVLFRAEPSSQDIDFASRQLVCEDILSLVNKAVSQYLAQSKISDM